METMKYDRDQFPHGTGVSGTDRPFEEVSTIQVFHTTMQKKSGAASTQGRGHNILVLKKIHSSTCQFWHVPFYYETFSSL